MKVLLLLALAMFVPSTATGKPVQDDDQTDGKTVVQGLWKLHVEKTTAELKATGNEDSARMLDFIKSMSLNLKEDGTFEMTVPSRPGITGKWTASLQEAKDGEDAKKTGRISMDPDNLGDEHEDMHFDYVMIEPNVAKLKTPINPVPLIFAREKKKGDKDQDDDGSQGR